MIEALDVTVRIGPKTLLDRVTLRVRPGETVALVGPNGAGKSTLLRVLSGDIEPEFGSVLLRGWPLSGYGPGALARHRAVLAQSIAVGFPFTVEEVVRMGAGGLHGGGVDAEIETALAAVDMAGFENRIVTTLSGGEQQRVHCARVLVQLACAEAENGPGLLLLDEPTASLDLRHQIELLSAMKRRAETGTAIVAVLHDLNLAALFAGRVVAMAGGRVAADGPVAEIVSDALLREVFGVHLPVGRIPPPGTPFVLPHAVL